jgi:hypothetical protein
MTPAAGQEFDREHAGREGGAGDVRADRVHGLRADADDLVVLIERKLAGHDLIAPVRITLQGFGAG